MTVDVLGVMLIVSGEKSNRRIPLDDDDNHGTVVVDAAAD